MVEAIVEPEPLTGDKPPGFAFPLLPCVEGVEYRCRIRCRRGRRGLGWRRRSPLYQLMKKELLSSKVIGTDDTSVKVLDRKLPFARIGRIWPYVGDAHHPVIVYDYTPTRSVLSAVRHGRRVHGCAARSYRSLAGERDAGSGRLSGDTRHHGPSRCACRGRRGGSHGLSPRGRRCGWNVCGSARASCRRARGWHGALVFGGTRGADGGRAGSRSQ